MDFFGAPVRRRRPGPEPLFSYPWRRWRHRHERPCQDQSCRFRSSDQALDLARGQARGKAKCPAM